MSDINIENLINYPTKVFDKLNENELIIGFKKGITVTWGVYSIDDVVVIHESNNNLFDKVAEVNSEATEVLNLSCSKLSEDDIYRLIKEYNKYLYLNDNSLDSRIEKLLNHNRLNLYNKLSSYLNFKSFDINSLFEFMNDNNLSMVYYSENGDTHLGIGKNESILFKTPHPLFPPACKVGVMNDIIYDFSELFNNRGITRIFFLYSSYLKGNLTQPDKSEDSVTTEALTEVSTELITEDEGNKNIPEIKKIEFKSNITKFISIR